MNNNQKLVAAVKEGDVEGAKRLVCNERASVQYRDEESGGKTPREIAITMGHHPLIEFLIGEELRDAAGKGDIGAVETLLKSKANVNSQSPNEKFYMLGSSALHCASTYGHQSVVEFLLNSNAHINIQTKDGWTPLHNASRNDNAAVVKVLLARNADPTIKNTDEMTARDVAVDEQKLAVVKVFDAPPPPIPSSSSSGEAALDSKGK